MAQGQGSFLYQIKLALDEGGATSAFNSAVSQMRKQMRGLRTEIEGTMQSFSAPEMLGGDFSQGRGLARVLAQQDKLQEQAKTLEATKRRISAEQKSINKSLARKMALEKQVANTVERNAEKVLKAGKARTLQVKTQEELNENKVESGNIEAQNLGAKEEQTDETIKQAEAEEEVTKEKTRSSNVTEEQTKEQQEFTQATMQSAEAQEEVNSAVAAGNSRFNKTTQTSQNLLRITQDAQFGMMGMANNVQALAESLGRASTRGRTALGQLKAGFMSLVSGPMAIPFVITLVTLLFQNLEKLPGPVKDLFGEVRDVIEQLGIMNTELENIIANIEDTDSKFKVLKNLSEEARAVFQDDLEGRVKFFERAIEQKQEELELDKTREEIVQEQLENGKNRTQAQIAANEILMERLRNMAEANQKVREFREQLEKQQKVLKIINQEEAKREAKIEALTDIQGITREQAEKALEIEKEKTKEKEDQFDFQRKLAELQVEAMQEGLQKELAQIELSIEKRRQKIRQLREENKLTEKQAEIWNNLLDQIESRERGQVFEERQTEAEFEGGFAGLGFVRIGGQFVDPDKFIEQQKQKQEQVLNQLDRRRQALRDERQQGAISGPLDALGAVEQGFQQNILKQEEEIRKERIKAQREFLKSKLEVAKAQGEDEKAAQIQNRLNTMRTVADIEKKWQEKRKRQHQQFLQGIIDNYETTPVGDAVMNMTNQIGGIIQSFQSDQLNWAEKTQTEKARIISQAGGQVLGAASNVAEGVFQTWKSKREQDLKQQGKSEEERRKIMKEEGKKRFQIMKAIKIANAITSGISATIASYEKGAQIGGPPVGAAFAATTAAAMAMKINQLRQISIGDKLGGGVGGGAESGGEFTQRAAASAASAASLTGTALDQERNKTDEELVKDTAKEVGKQVANNMPDKVTMDNNTAEQSVEVGNAQQNKLNK